MIKPGYLSGSGLFCFLLFKQLLSSIFVPQYYFMKSILFLFVACIGSLGIHAQETTLNQDIAEQLARLPLSCIPQEFPNKTSHSADAAEDARLLPSELHPAFYGCFDWHSSVHGHWMLVRLLKTFPELRNRDSIIAVLSPSFTLEKMQAEADYFSAYSVASTFERTYGWAWLLQLDHELQTWNDPLGQKWHEAMYPLTQKIVDLWKAYLPKQTYPNRTGVHPNTAFGLSFALDWALSIGDTSFQHMIEEKARYFYADNKAIPAYLEPDGSDFFSPSLQAAELMSKVLPAQDFISWLEAYYEPRSLERICQLPHVSDRSDYQIVHLDGLSFSRAWCMRHIAAKLPPDHPFVALFQTAARDFLNQTLPEIFNGHYGGAHWLASFAVYALGAE